MFKTDGLYLCERLIRSQCEDKKLTDVLEHVNQTSRSTIMFEGNLVIKCWTT